jgi:hypothetical protein
MSLSKLVGWTLTRINQKLCGNRRPQYYSFSIASDRYRINHLNWLIENVNRKRGYTAMILQRRVSSKRFPSSRRRRSIYHIPNGTRVQQDRTEKTVFIFRSLLTNRGGGGLENDTFVLDPTWICIVAVIHAVKAFSRKRTNNPLCRVSQLHVTSDKLCRQRDYAGSRYPLNARVVRKSFRDKRNDSTGTIRYYCNTTLRVRESQPRSVCDCGQHGRGRNVCDL